MVSLLVIDRSASVDAVYDGSVLKKTILMKPIEEKLRREEYILTVWFSAFTIMLNISRFEMRF
jgi:hypothetical protein